MAAQNNKTASRQTSSAAVVLTELLQTMVTSMAGVVSIRHAAHQITPARQPSTRLGLHRCKGTRNDVLCTHPCAKAGSLQAEGADRPSSHAGLLINDNMTAQG